MFKKQVILQFDNKKELEQFVHDHALTSFTIHKELPVLYCRLDKATIREAITNYSAIDMSKDDQSGYSTLNPYLLPD